MLARRHFFAGTSVCLGLALFTLYGRKDGAPRLLATAAAAALAGTLTYRQAASEIAEVDLGAAAVTGVAGGRISRVPATLAYRGCPQAVVSGA